MAVGALSPWFSEDSMKLICCNLSLLDLAQCCQVSKLWRKCADSDDVWRRIVPGIEEFAQEHIREYVSSHALWSKDAVEKRLEEFLKQISLHQKWTFWCFFPFNPVCRIAGDFGYGRCSKSDMNHDHTEVCIFLKKPLPNEWRDENLPRIVYNIKEEESLNVNWTPLEVFLKQPVIFIDFRTIHGDWEEKIFDKVKKIWSAQKDELNVQYNEYTALAW